MGPNKEVIKRNILEVAYQQIAENYPRFMPFIIRYNLNEIDTQNSTAIGSFSLLIKNQLLTIPIIYREGNVDAISYIGNDETGEYYALTKLLYNKIADEVVNDLGKVITKKTTDDDTVQYPVDRGVIGSLFATPTTFSPKVASYNPADSNSEFSLEKLAQELKLAPVKSLKFSKSDLLMDIAFKDPEFADKLVKTASEDTPLGKLIKKLVDIDEVKRYARFTKTASQIDTKPVVYFTLDEIKHFPKSKRQEAFTKIATQGFYIDRQKDEKVFVDNFEKIASNITKTLKKNVREITQSGIWTIWSVKLEPQACVVAKHLNDRELKIYTKTYTYPTESSGCSALGILRPTFTINDVKLILGGKSISTIDKADRDERFTMFIVKPSTEIFSVSFYKSDVTKIPEGYLIDVNGSVGATSFGQIIVTNRVSRLILNQGYLYVPEKNAVISETGNFRTARELLNTCNYTNLTNTLPLMKVASVSPDLFIVNGEKFSKRGLIIKLANEGYSDKEIKKLLKVASSPNSEQLLLGLNQQIAQLTQIAQQQTLTMQQVAQLLAQLKKDTEEEKKLLSKSLKQLGQLTAAAVESVQPQQDPNVQNMQDPAQMQIDPNAQAQQAQLLQAIQELAVQLGIDPNELLQKAQAQGMSLEDLYMQMQNYVAQIQQAQQMPQPQDPTQMQAQEVPQQAQPNPAQAMQDPTQSQQPQQINPELPPTDDNGFFLNNISPEVLKILEEFANKQVAESAILSYLTDIENPKSVIKQYSEQIKAGINALVRILLMIETNYPQLIKTVSETTVSSFLNRGKSLARRLTDFYINLENL